MHKGVSWKNLENRIYLENTRVDEWVVFILGFRNSLWQHGLDLSVLG
jgi:hypothetical protein